MKTELAHICTNCKYRNMQEGYDQQWGMTIAVKNWCGKDRKLMDTFYGVGNGKYFSEPCEYFEAGKGTCHKIKEIYGIAADETCNAIANRPKMPFTDEDITLIKENPSLNFFQKIMLIKKIKDSMSQSEKETK